MNLILFGFKGAGKTHFGNLLAHKMQRPFVDTDNILIELYGEKKSVREIYKELGEQEFRKLEKKTIPYLKELTDTIIAVGGGFVLDPSNVEALQTIGALVYLKASPATLQKRIKQDELPPSLANMLQEREPIYRSIRAHVVDTEKLDEAGVLAALNSIVIAES